MNDKKELRKHFLSLRNSQSNEQLEETDLNIFNNLICLDEFVNSKNVLIYVSVKKEPDTRGIISYCLENNKNVFIPECVGENMFFRHLSYADDLKEGKYSIPVSCSEDGFVLTDFFDCLCIVPGLAFDSNGNRLGYGGGFYDRFLSKHSIPSVGLCREFAFLPQLPVDEFDVSVNKIVTENKIINCRKL